MDFSVYNMVLIWLILLVVFVLVEVLTTQLVSIWFAGGALISLILAFINVKVNIQIIVFFVSSIAFLCITYPLYHKYMKNEVVHLNANSLIGKDGIVIKEINNKVSLGQIKIKGQVWSASSDSDEIIKEGEEVTVLKIEGVHAVVKRKKEVKK